MPDKVLQVLIERVPVKRLGKPEDIARAILFLTADDADFITDETL